jgi:nicotinate-nucleotide adenylyltransferase
MGQRIGLFGGTFDPPHTGHLAGAVAARSDLRLDRVILVVANNPWQKSNQRPVTEAHHRLAMVRLLVEGFDGIEASDLEISRGGPSYTIDTVNELQDRGDEVLLIVGADAAAGLDSWDRSDELRECVEVAVVDRPGYLFPELNGWRLNRVKAESVDVSSSGVRDLVSAGASAHDSIPSTIRNYIDLHRLDWS